VASASALLRDGSIPKGGCAPCSLLRRFAPRVETQQSFVNQLVGFLTLGI